MTRLALILALPMAALVAQAPTLSDADKLRIRDAELNMQRAYSQLLETPQYRSWWRATDDLKALVSETEKEHGCKLNLTTLECK